MRWSRACVPKPVHGNVWYDLTSSYFEGLAENNDLAKHGYSRDHRPDCKQIVLALVVTREGFPLAHSGNKKDVQTVQHVVKEIERRFGQSRRVWVLDRGMISQENIAFLSVPGRYYLISTRRSELESFQDELTSGGRTLKFTGNRATSYAARRRSVADSLA